MEILDSCHCWFGLAALAKTRSNSRVPVVFRTCLLIAISAVAYGGTVTFSGELNAGERFERPVGRGLVFLLIPTDAGWTAEIRTKGGSDNLASCVCCPLHGPRVFEIESWNYFGEQSDRPAQGDVRSFDFSLTGRDYADACSELGVIDGDVRRGSNAIGSTGYRAAPTGRCTLRVKVVSGKTSIEHLSFSVAIRMSR